MFGSNQNNPGNIASAAASTSGVGIANIFNDKSPKAIRILLAGGPLVNPTHHDFIERLTRRIMEEVSPVFILVTGGTKCIQGDNGLYVDYLAADTANNYLQNKGLNVADRVITILPAKENPKYKRFQIGETVHIYSDGRQRRDEIVNKYCDIIILLGGLEIAVPDYWELAKNYNKPILPLPFAGGKSSKIWEGDENRKDIKRLFSLTDDEINLLFREPIAPSIQEKIAELCIRLAKRVVNPIEIAQAPKNIKQEIKVTSRRRWLKKSNIIGLLTTVFGAIFIPLVFHICQSKESKTNVHLILSNNNKNTDTLLANENKNVDTILKEIGKVHKSNLQQNSYAPKSSRVDVQKYIFSKTCSVGESFVDSLTGAIIGISLISSGHTASGTISLPNMKSTYFSEVSPGKTWQFSYSNKKFNLIITKLEIYPTIFTIEVRELGN